MMTATKEMDCFCAFMEEYAVFFEGMAEQEKEKLAALLSYQLKRIETAISSQQAGAMRLDSYEKKRAELQEAAGLGGKTFSEIIAVTDGALCERLQKLFERTSAAIQAVQYYNQKSMESVKLDLQKLNATASAEEKNEARGYTAQKTQATSYASSSFETKI